MEHEKNNGFSAASTDDKFTATPEVEQLTREILELSGHSANPSNRCVNVRRVAKDQTDESENNSKRTVRPRSKKRISIIALKVFLAVVLTVLAAVAFEIIHLKRIMNSVNYMPHANHVTSTELVIDKEYIKAHVSHSDATKNILLIGSDVDKNGISRSDSIIILSIDHDHSKIKITSLMRDMYVTIPKNGKHKINAAFTFGGPELLTQTIYSNFGFVADNYISVDYDAFAAIVDSIGGVEITLAENELEQFNKYVSGGSKNKLKAAGTYNMNGQQALSYCRIRKVGSDTIRTSRQRRVLDRIIEKCSKMNYFKLKGMMEEIAPMITTDFTQSEMLHMLAEAFVSSDYDTMQMRIPVDGTWNGKYINKIWYMMFDLPQNAQYLNDFVYGDDDTAEQFSNDLLQSDLDAAQ